MDKLVYTSMTGARYLLARQDTLAQNLAHASTGGYRAQIDAFRTQPLAGADTRAFAVDSTVGADFTPGPVQRTGRDLDVAIAGRGWLSVQAADGTEAYTRAGSLDISPEGQLQTRGGLMVLGDGGPITVPQGAQVSIADDGTVSAIPATGARTPVLVGRLKLSNPDEATLVRGTDGNFRTRDGEPAAADPAVRLTSQALEGSNVNPVEAMVTMIAVARQFEMQMKMIASADDNARQADKLLAHNG